jgi:hypothetical protein
VDLLVVERSSNDNEALNVALYNNILRYGRISLNSGLRMRHGTWRCALRASALASTGWGS